MKLTTIRLAVLVALASAGTAQAQDVIATAGTDWRGFFLGGNIGGAWNHTCQSWTPGPGITGNPALATAFYNRDCPNNGNFIGGVDLGYNFQHDQWVWGLKVDYDAVGNKSNNRSYTYTASGPARSDPERHLYPSGKVSPNGIGLLGPRIGYAFDQWLPYLQGGRSLCRRTTYEHALVHAGGRIDSERSLDQRGQELQVERLQCRPRF